MNRKDHNHSSYQGNTFLFACSCVLILLSCAFILKDASHEPYELKYPSSFGSRFTIPKDNPMTKEGVALGRMLFYEELLSANNEVSCGTCHIQKLAFTDARQFSVGVDGTPTRRNSMSLSNLLWVRSLFWDGRASTLEEQMIVPLTDPHEMGQSLQVSSNKLQQSGDYPLLFEKTFGTREITGERIIKALAQFERTLISANSPYDQYLRGDYEPTPSELRGLALFATGPQPNREIRGANCAHCHGMPQTFTDTFHNNGLDSIFSDLGREVFTGQFGDRGRFRVPTLRNIALTAPYMHDGRFATLNDVLDHYSEHIKQSETLSPFIAEPGNIPGQMGLRLTENEKVDIINFLNMLTDQDFISNPEFADPAEMKKL
jgi:cytochrome c peroxidase